MNLQWPLCAIQRFAVFFKTLPCHSLADRHFRKAHPKAKRFGGTKKVEGLKSNLTDKIRNIEKTVQIVSSEDLSLFARLDELEEKETKNAELDQLWQDDSDSKENVTASGCSKEGGDTREGLPQKQDTNQTKKKVTWEARYVKNEAVVSSSDSSGSDDDDGVQSTISVKFSSSSVPLQGKVSCSFYCCQLIYYTDVLCKC